MSRKIGVIGGKSVPRSNGRQEGKVQRCGRENDGWLIYGVLPAFCDCLASAVFGLFFALVCAVFD